MKVRIRKYVTVEVETEVLIDQEVDVCMDDVMAGFFQEARDLRQNEGRDRVVVSGELNGLVDGITKVLSLILDEHIRSLTPEMRAHHRRRLVAQADRYAELEAQRHPAAEHSSLLDKQ